MQNASPALERRKLKKQALIQFRGHGAKRTNRMSLFSSISTKFVKQNSTFTLCIGRRRNVHEFFPVFAAMLAASALVHV